MGSPSVVVNPDGSRVFAFDTDERVSVAPSLTGLPLVCYARSGVSLATGLLAISDADARLAHVAHLNGSAEQAARTLAVVARLLDDPDPPATPNGLRFRTAREIADSTPDAPTWIARPWAVQGGITEIDGKIKSAGKTTFVMALCRAVLDGDPFMGQTTTRGLVVYLTEQADSSLREALRRADLLTRDDLAILSWADTRGRSWPDIVREATAYARSIGATLLVIDTLPQWAGLRGDAENNAGEALNAIAPVQEAAATGLAVIVVRHERKGGGDVGDSARGSSAFGGAVDVVVQIQRGEGNTRPSIRVLNSLSRYDETPAQLVIDLTDDGYVALGDKTAVADAEARTAIVKAAPQTEASAQTTEDLAEAAAIKRTVAFEAIKDLFARGQICRTGTGYRGKPFRYWRPEGGGTRNDSSVTRDVEADESIWPAAIDSSGTPVVADESFPPSPWSSDWDAASIHSSATSSLGTDESIPPASDDDPENWPEIGGAR